MRRISSQKRAIFLLVTSAATISKTSSYVNPRSIPADWVKKPSVRLNARFYRLLGHFAGRTKEAAIKHTTKGNVMSLGTILIILLILALVGVLTTWGYSTSWGYAPGGIVGLLLVIIIILALLGRI